MSLIPTLWKADAARSLRVQDQTGVYVYSEFQDSQVYIVNSGQKKNERRRKMQEEGGKKKKDKRKKERRRRK